MDNHDQGAGVGPLNALDQLYEYLRQGKSYQDTYLGIHECVVSSLVSGCWQKWQHPCDLSTLLSTEAWQSLRRSLLRRLLWSAGPTLACEYPKIIALGQDQRFSTTSRIVKGLTESAIATARSHVMRDYPELARLWRFQMKCWQKQTSSFVRNARGFAATIGFKRDRTTMISNLKPDQSAPHDGGRTVMQVRFRDGSEWFYKPRPGWYELQWFKLLDWLNRERFPSSFRILRVECFKDHCWMEAVRPSACRDRKELSSFYFRIGALAYLIHLLGGVDFHRGNLIAVGDQPVFIDFETLLHPASYLPAYARSEEGSILRTGLFPVAKGAGHSSAPLAQSISGKHIPQLNGYAANASDFIEELVNGFRAIHKFLLSDRGRRRHLKEVAVHLAEIPGRNVYRPTIQYFVAAQRSFSPYLMRSPSRRREFLFASCSLEAASKRQTYQEMRALRNADIPVFRFKRRQPTLDFSHRTVAYSTSIIRDKLGGRK